MREGHRLIERKRNRVGESEKASTVDDDKQGEVKKTYSGYAKTSWQQAENKFQEKLEINSCDNIE